MISGYTVSLDDSGTHRGSEAVCLAGFIGQDHRWKKVVKEWNSTLYDYGVDSFHGTKLAHYEGEYKGWDEARRTRFTKRLIDIVAAHLSSFIMSTVHLEDYRQLVPANLRQRIGSPIALAMKGVLLNVDVWARDFSQIEPVGFLIDSGMKGRGEIAALLRRVRKHEKLSRELHIGALAEDLVERRPELQAADLHAYESYRFVTDQVINANKAGRGIRRPLNRILVEFGKDRNYSKGFDRHGIGVYLRRVRNGEIDL